MFGRIRQLGVRKMVKGFIQPADVFIIGVILILCFLMLWYAIGTLFPDTGIAFWK